MATLNGSDFVSRYNNSSTGAFKPGQNRGMGSDDMRDLVESINDSFINAIDELQLLTSTAGDNAYTLVGDLDAYATGFMVAVKVVNASTGASTLNINSLGAKKLYKNPTTQVGNGDLVANQAYICIYDAALDSANGGFHVIGLGGGESYTAETPIEIEEGVVKFTGGNFSVSSFNMTSPGSGRMFLADSGYDIIGNVYLLLRAKEGDVQHAQFYVEQDRAEMAIKSAGGMAVLMGLEFNQATGKVILTGVPEATGPKIIYLDPVTNELSYHDAPSISGPPDATELVKGIVELATTGEAITGTDTTKATHPAGVKAAILATLEDNIDSSSLLLPELGTIISDNFNRASLGSDWTNIGTASISIVSNQLQVSGGDNTVNNYIRWETYGNSNCESFTVTMDIVPGTINGTSYGVGLAIRSQGAFIKYDNYVKVNLDSGNLGKITFTYSNPSATPATGSKTTLSGIAVSASDSLTLKVRFVKDKYMIVLTNNTTGYAVHLDFQTSTQTPQASLTPNSYKFGIIAYGGTHIVDNFDVYSNDNKNVGLLCVGDSITKGLTTDNIYNRYTEQINNMAGIITLTNAGSGNKTTDINTNELLALEPEKILLLLGSNDRASGDSAATILANIDTLVDTLVTGGYVLGDTLFIGLLLPRNGVTGIDTINTGLISAYGSATIDFYTEANNAGTFRSEYTMDGTHPNNEYSKYMADGIMLKLNLLSKPKKVGNYYPLMYGSNEFVSVAESKFRGSQPNAQLDIINSTSLQLKVGYDNSTKGGYVFSNVDGALSLAANAYYRSGSWYAGGTIATIITLYQGNWYFYYNTGLTIGNTFTPTIRHQFSSTGAFFGGTTAPTSTLESGGSLGAATASVSTNTTLTVAHHTVRVDATSGNITITLPAASGCTRRIYVVKKTDATANTVTVDGNASETIDGATTKVLSTQYEKIVIQSNGTSWDIIG